MPDNNFSFKNKKKNLKKQDAARKASQRENAAYTSEERKANASRIKSYRDDEEYRSQERKANTSQRKSKREDKTYRSQEQIADSTRRKTVREKASHPSAILSRAIPVHSRESSNFTPFSVQMYLSPSNANLPPLTDENFPSLSQQSPTSQPPILSPQATVPPSKDQHKESRTEENVSQEHILAWLKTDENEHKETRTEKSESKQHQAQYLEKECNYKRRRRRFKKYGSNSSGEESNQRTTSINLQAPQWNLHAADLIPEIQADPISSIQDKSISQHTVFASPSNDFYTEQSQSTQFSTQHSALPPSKFVSHNHLDSQKCSLKRNLSQSPITQSLDSVVSPTPEVRNGRLDYQENTRQYETPTYAKIAHGVGRQNSIKSSKNKGKRWKTETPDIVIPDPPYPVLTSPQSSPCLTRTSQPPVLSPDYSSTKQRGENR